MPTRARSSTRSSIVFLSEGETGSHPSNKKARRRCRRGLQDFRNDVSVPVICPTSQICSKCDTNISANHNSPEAE
jgi:hypothetical protein